MSAPSTSILHSLFTRRLQAFPGMDVARTAQALVERGHVGGITAGTAIVDRIVAEGGRATSIDAHRRCPSVRALAEDARVLAVAQRYLEAEPRLHGAYLVWSPPGDDGYGRTFHHELIDLRALSLFVYLTDVDREASPHQVILGVEGRRETMVGRRGTAWFADQTILHRALGVPTRERGTLILTYTYPLP